MKFNVKLIFSPQYNLIKQQRHFLSLMGLLDLNGYFITRLLSLQDDRNVFTLDLGLSFIKKLSAEPRSQVRALWAESQWGKAFMDKKCFIIWSLSLVELAVA